jgi:hypothetical protein
MTSVFFRLVPLLVLALVVFALEQGLLSCQDWCGLLRCSDRCTALPVATQRAC